MDGNFIFPSFSIFCFLIWWLWTSKLWWNSDSIFWRKSSLVQEERHALTTVGGSICSIFESSKQILMSSCLVNNQQHLRTCSIQKQWRGGLIEEETRSVVACYGLLPFGWMTNTFALGSPGLWSPDSFRSGEQQHPQFSFNRVGGVNVVSSLWEHWSMQVALRLSRCVLRREICSVNARKSILTSENPSWLQRIQEHPNIQRIPENPQRIPENPRESMRSGESKRFWKRLQPKQCRHVTSSTIRKGWDGCLTS